MRMSQPNPSDGKAPAWRRVITLAGFPIIALTIAAIFLLSGGSRGTTVVVIGISFLVLAAGIPVLVRKTQRGHIRRD